MVLLLLSCPSYVCLLSLDRIKVGFVSIRGISRDKLGFVGILQSVSCVSYQRCSLFRHDDSPELIPDVVRERGRNSVPQDGWGR